MLARGSRGLKVPKKRNQNTINHFSTFSTIQKTDLFSCIFTHFLSTAGFPLKYLPGCWQCSVEKTGIHTVLNSLLYILILNNFLYFFGGEFSTGDSWMHPCPCMVYPAVCCRLSLACQFMMPWQLKLSTVKLSFLFLILNPFVPAFLCCCWQQLHSASGARIVE